MNPIPENNNAIANDRVNANATSVKHKVNKNIDVQIIARDSQFCVADELAISILVEISIFPSHIADSKLSNSLVQKARSLSVIHCPVVLMEKEILTFVLSSSIGIVSKVASVPQFFGENANIVPNFENPRLYMSEFDSFCLYPESFRNWDMRSCAMLCCVFATNSRTRFIFSPVSDKAYRPTVCVDCHWITHGLCLGAGKTQSQKYLKAPDFQDRIVVARGVGCGFARMHW